MDNPHKFPEEPTIVVIPSKKAGFPRHNVLYIQTLQGTKIELGIDFGDTTVGHVKYWIFRRTGIHPSQQKLIFAGREMLDDEMTLTKTNIEYECTWHLLPNRTKGHISESESD